MKAKKIITLILFFIFLTLKLADIGQVANWSWWWVTAPLWINGSLWFISIVIQAFVDAKKEVEQEKSGKSSFQMRIEKMAEERRKKFNKK